MTVRRVKNHKRKGAFLKVGFFLYLGFCLFATVWLKAAVVNLEYELGDFEIMRADLIGERKLVAARRSNVYSTEKIEKVALRRLEMRLPDRENVFFIKKISAAGPYRASMK